MSEKIKGDYTVSPVLKDGTVIDLQLKECDRPNFVQIRKHADDTDSLRMLEVALKVLCVDGEVERVVADFKALKSCEIAIYQMITVEPVELKKN